MTASPAHSRFEEAVEAIIHGDAAGLERLLEEDSALVRERSIFPHASTLLHYVSANGVEDERQVTPPNIVEIARILLDAGADVNAESQAYGGHSTTLYLTATSYHPQKAGVQIALLALLLSRGAAIDGPDGSSVVNSCLANGRAHAAAYLAAYGARLDVEGAAGVGRLDVLETAERDPARMARGFAWACEFDQPAAAEWLLEHGVDVNDCTLPNHRNTGLHWAAHSGHAELVGMLLDRGARVDLRDATFQGTPLDWALHGYAGAAEHEGYYEVAAQLVRAGATFEPPTAIKLDEAMRRALSGQAPE